MTTLWLIVSNDQPPLWFTGKFYSGQVPNTSVSLKEAKTYESGEDALEELSTFCDSLRTIFRVVRDGTKR